MAAAGRMTGMYPQQRTVGPWVYPKSAAVLAVARLKPIVTYIRQRRHDIKTNIEGRALLEECMGGGEVERNFKSPSVVGAGDGPGGG